MRFTCQWRRQTFFSTVTSQLVTHSSLRLHTLSMNVHELLPYRIKNVLYGSISCRWSIHFDGYMSGYGTVKRLPCVNVCDRLPPPLSPALQPKTFKEDKHIETMQHKHSLYDEMPTIKFGLGLDAFELFSNLAMGMRIFSSKMMPEKEWIHHAFSPSGPFLLRAKFNI